MVLEIEMKAWVRNPHQIESKLAGLGYSKERSYKKEDVYFKSSESQDVRVRLDDGIGLVTFKDKTIADGLEINQENEFEVSNPAMMVDLLGRLGCSETIKKIKIGSAWRKTPLLAEFSEIVGLGYFLELEKVVEVPDDTLLQEQSRIGNEIKALIIGAFTELGITQSDIESKTYTSMLLALKSAQ